MSKDRIIDVRIPGERPYQVRIGRGALSTLAGTVRDLKECRRVVVISDENVGPKLGKTVREYLSGAGFETYDLLIPPGEESKSLEMAGELWSAIADYGFNRDDLIVAVGGGVVGDLAGFVAATYMRGIDVVQVPTSLLAMVDASVGGKTAIDLPQGKNLVGAFHQPLHVCIDINVLSALPDAEWANGFAEIAKSSVVAPRRSFYEWLRNNAAGLVSRDPMLLEEAVYTTVDFKASVVMKDATESNGQRASLNYGHTLGHAIEASSGLGTIGHGRAVAEGMRFATRLAVEVADADIAFVQRVDALLDSLGLPQLPFQLSPEDLLAHMKTDKKARGGVVNFVIAEDFTSWELMAVPDDVLRSHLTAWCQNKARLAAAQGGAQ